uniref:hypothetical protein n=1 Tax=Agathobacter sp. TaxID=2021311 RepID=UPI004057A9EE
MIKMKKELSKKAFCFAATGVMLQIIGSIFLFISTFSIMKELNHQIKQLIIEKLSD